MSSLYSSPPSSLRSLRDRLVQAARREGLVFGRLQQHVAVLVVAQLAARLTDGAGAPLLLVKGGSSLELRRGIRDSRTSKDLDTVARIEVAEVHELLADAGEVGWEGFTAIIHPARGDRRAGPAGQAETVHREVELPRSALRLGADRGVDGRGRQCGTV